MKITLGYDGPATEAGARFRFEHDAEVRDVDDAITVGREFATLTNSLIDGMIEGQRVANRVSDE